MDESEGSCQHEQNGLDCGSLPTYIAYINLVQQSRLPMLHVRFVLSSFFCLSFPSCFPSSHCAFLSVRACHPIHFIILHPTPYIRHYRHTPKCNLFRALLSSVRFASPLHRPSNIYKIEVVPIVYTLGRSINHAVFHVPSTRPSVHRIQRAL